VGGRKSPLLLLWLLAYTTVSRDAADDDKWIARNRHRWLRLWGDECKSIQGGFWASAWNIPLSYLLSRRSRRRERLMHLFVCLLVRMSPKCKNATFLKTKQFRAGVYWWPTGNRTWAFQRTHYRTHKMKDGGDLTSWKSTWRHFSAAGCPIWTKFRKLLQYDMPTAVIWSKWKQEVEFQYGGRLFFESRNSYISAADWVITTIETDNRKTATLTDLKP